MITLRHHAISLAAVFLALTVGIVLGSGLLSDSLLPGTRAEQRDLRAQIDSLRDGQHVLDGKLSAADDFDTQMAGRMVRGELTDKSVVVFRTPDAHSDDVDAVSKIVAQAGGVVTGTVSLTEQFVEGDSAEKLRSVVDSSILPPGAELNTRLVDPGSQAGDLLGIALLVKPEDPAPATSPDPATPPAPAAPAVDESQRDTVLAALRDTGFLTYPDRVGPANTAVVVTGGPLGDDAGNRGPGVARFAAALAPHGSATVLAGRDGCASGTAAVAVARAEPAIAGAISTVDNIDAERGRITAIMAVGSLLDGGHPGQYGIGPGAASVTVAR